MKIAVWVSAGDHFPEEWIEVDEKTLTADRHNDLEEMAERKVLDDMVVWGWRILEGS